MNAGIILASGTGERFSGDIPKQFVKLAGMPVLVHTIKVFQNSNLIDKIVVVTNKQYVDKVWEYVKQYDLSKVTKVVIGGDTRQESSYYGLIACKDLNPDYVVIHDGVRPFITEKILVDNIKAVIIHKAVDTVIRSADTIVKVDGKNFIESIPNREFLRRGQTPQSFEYSLILDAHNKAIDDNITNSTDDCFLVLRLGHKVYTVYGSEENIKITYPIDLHIADKLFQLRSLKYFENSLLKILKDKNIVIIGGTSGIGKSLTEKLLNLNANVIVASRKTNPQVDITNYTSIKDFFNHILKKFKKIDYVINCAGDLIRRNVEFMAIDEWDYIYNVNIRSCFLLSKVLIPIFKKQNYGNIMFIGSSAYTRGRSGYAAYSSSKAALVNFVQALSEEVDDYNIKVNVVVPSRVNTPLRKRNFGKEDPNSLLSPEYVAEKIIKALLMNTTGSVFDIQ